MTDTKNFKFLFVYPDFLGNEKRKDLKGNYHEGIAIISAGFERTWLPDRAVPYDLYA